MREPALDLPAVGSVAAMGGHGGSLGRRRPVSTPSDAARTFEPHFMDSAVKRFVGVANLAATTGGAGMAEYETWHVVKLHEDIDFNSAMKVRALLLDCVEHGRELCVDMSKVPYIDSAGIACLLEAHYAADEKGGSFSLANVGDAVMRTLGNARLETVFTILELGPSGQKPDLT